MINYLSVSQSWNLKFNQMVNYMYLSVVRTFRHQLKNRSQSWVGSPLTKLYRLQSHVRVQRGRGTGSPWKITKILAILAILVRIPLKITKLPSQHLMLGHHRHASETPFKWRFAGGPMMARLNGVSLACRWWPDLSCIWIHSLTQKNGPPLKKLSGIAHEFGSGNCVSRISECKIMFYFFLPLKICCKCLKYAVSIETSRPNPIMLSKRTTVLWLEIMKWAIFVYCIFITSNVFFII